MGRECGKYGREENYVQGFGGKPEKRDHVENLCIYYKVINIKMYLK